METETLQGVRDILKGGTSEYWLTHYTFGGSSPSRPKTLSNTSLDLLIINTVVTFLYAYGLHKGNPVLCARAGRFLEELIFFANTTQSPGWQQAIPIRKNACIAG